MSGNFWVRFGSISAFTAVCTGAFGAHALSKRIDPGSLSIFQTATHYQMYHALALIGLGVWTHLFPKSRSGLAGWAFAIGTLLFSGSLYALALTGVKALGLITPVGGVSFLIGWMAFARLAYCE